jgi:hypothetical protein
MTTPKISMHQSSFSIQSDSIIEFLGEKRIIYGRWNKRFGVWRKRGPGLPAERYLPDWPILDAAGNFCLEDEANCDRDLEFGSIAGDQPRRWHRSSEGDLQSRSPSDFLREYVDEIPPEVRRAAGRLGPFQWRALEGMAQFPEMIRTLDPGRPLSKLQVPLACWVLTEDEAGDGNIANTVNAAIANGRTREFIRNWIGPRGGHLATASGKLDVGVDHFGDAVRTLRMFVQDSRRLRISVHLTSINHFALRYLELAPDELLFPNVALAISKQPCSTAADFFEAVFFEEIARGEMQEVRTREILKSVRCPESLERATWKLRTQVLNLEFPPAPFASKPPLLPITSSRDLAQESGRMKHCARSFVEEVVNGSMYFYRWCEEPAVTLALEHRDGAWVLNDVRCAKNEAVPVVALQKMLSCLELGDAGHKSVRHKQRAGKGEDF